MSVLIFSLLLPNLYAAVLKHEISSSLYKELDYIEVCEAFSFKNAVLVSPRISCDQRDLKYCYFSKHIGENLNEI